MKKRYVLSCCLCLLLIGLAATIFHNRSAQAAADAANRIGVVIAYGDGSVQKQCVSFSSDSISGLQALQSAGVSLEVSYNSTGAAVCKIGKVGCPADICFCDSPPNFWSYWHLKDGGWVFSPIGSIGFGVSNGAVEGWIWGTGQGNPPPLFTFDQICSPLPAASATPPPPTLTSIPTLPPTGTPTDAPTARPTSAPTTAPSAAPVKPTVALPTWTKSPMPSKAVAATLKATATSTLAPAATKMTETAFPTASATAVSSATPQATATAASTVVPTLAVNASPTVLPTADAAGSSADWHTYLPFAAIVAVLGIGFFVVAQKQWK